MEQQAAASPDPSVPCGEAGGIPGDPAAGEGCRPTAPSREGCGPTARSGEGCGGTLPGDAHPRRGRLSAARLEPLQREECRGWTQPGRCFFRGEGEGEEAESLLFYFLIFFFSRNSFLPSCPEMQSRPRGWGSASGRRRGLARETPGNPGATGASGCGGSSDSIARGIPPRH